MPTVQLPNGDSVDFPEGMSPEEMGAAIRSNFPEFAPKTGLVASAMDAVGNAAKSAYDWATEKKPLVAESVNIPDPQLDPELNRQTMLRSSSPDSVMFNAGRGKAKADAAVERGAALEKAVAEGGFASVEDMLAEPERSKKQKNFAEDLPGFARGMAKGAGQAKGLALGTAGLVGDLTGIDDLKEWGLQGYRDTMRKAGDFSVAKNFTDIKSPSDAAGWVAENAGYVGFQAAQSILSAGLGGAIGSTIGKKALGEIVGMVMANSAQTYGSVYGEATDEARKTGKPVDMEKVLIGATASMAIDTIADKIGLDAITANGFKGGALSRIGKSVGLQVGVQGGTEAAQLIPEEWGAGRDPFRDGMLKQYINEAAVGGLGGGGPGLVGAIKQNTQGTEPSPIPPSTPTKPTADDILAKDNIDDITQTALASVGASGFDLLSSQARDPLQDAMRAGGPVNAAPVNTEPATLLDQQLSGRSALQDEIRRIRESAQQPADAGFFTPTERTDGANTSTPPNDSTALRSDGAIPARGVESGLGDPVRNGTDALRPDSDVLGKSGESAGGTPESALTDSIDGEILNLQRIEAINKRQGLGLDVAGMASDRLRNSGRISEVFNSTPAASTQSAPIGVTSSEKLTTTPVAESQAPASSGSGDASVAPGRDGVEPIFDYTTNTDGTVLVHGDPTEIRTAGINGPTKFTDGKPAGVLVSVTNAPKVIAQLEAAPAQPVAGSGAAQAAAPVSSGTNPETEVSRTAVEQISTPISYDAARALVAGKTEKPGGVDPVKQIDAGEGNKSVYRIGDVPLSMFRNNESGVLYDGTVSPKLAADYSARDPKTAPPVIAVLSPKTGKLNILDGGNRITAARMRGDETISTIISFKPQGTPNVAQAEKTITENKGRKEAGQQAPAAPAVDRRTLVTTPVSQRAALQQAPVTREAILAQLGPEPGVAIHGKPTEAEFQDHLDYNRREDAAKIAAIGPVEDAVIVKNVDRDAWKMVVQDASTPGKWRVSTFDKSGFSGHDIHDTKEQAIADAAGSWFIQRDDTALDRLQDTPEFQRGLYGAELISRMNRGEIDYKELNRLMVERQNQDKSALKETPIQQGSVSVGDTVFFTDVRDEKKRIAGNFRGFNGDQVVVVWNGGQQMSLPKDRVFKNDINPASPAVAQPSAREAVVGRKTLLTTPVEQRNVSPDHLGRNNVPINEGGKYFASKEEAQQARKNNPSMRVGYVKNKKGKKQYTLIPKTDAQIAAHEAAGRRLARGNVGGAGLPMSAHQFIAREGGLSKDHKSDLGIEGNPRIGALRLYSGTGGLTIEQASEKLKEAGYLPPEANHTQAFDLIRKSLQTPQYTPEGWERVGQIEQEARFADHLEAQQDQDPFAALQEHDFDESDAIAAGFDEASPELKAEVAALASFMDAKGLDSETIRMDIVAQNPNATDKEYHELTKAAYQSAIEAAVARSDSNAGKNDGEQGSAPEAGRSEEVLTPTTPDQVKADEERVAQAEKDKIAADKAADDKAKADRIAKEIADRQAASADNFQLGQSAEDALAGQGSVFDAPAEKPADPVAAAKPATIEQSSVQDLLRAAADKMDAEKAGPTVARTNPKETIVFKTPITGPSGAKLVSYTWQWRPMDVVDARGEDRTVRISDWDKSEVNAETGRDVVHQFQVVDADGAVKVVSAETAIKELGYGTPEQGAGVKSVATTAKTLARLKMQLAETEQALGAFNADKAKVDALATPSMPTERDEKGWFNLGDAQVRQIETGPMLDERRKALISAWRDNRLSELGWKNGSFVGENLSSSIDDLNDRIKRAEKRLAATVDAAQPAGKIEAAQDSAPAEDAAYASRTINDVRSETGQKGVWIGDLDKNGDLHPVRLTHKGTNRADYYFDIYADGKVSDSIPFPAITGNNTVQEASDTLLDYVRIDNTDKWDMRNIGAKHAQLKQAKSSAEQNAQDRETVRMRKARGDNETRPWDATDAETLIELDRYTAKRYKSNSDEKMIEILTARLKSDPTKWRAGDGVGYHVARQINRGFQVESIDEASKTAYVIQVADTGLTTSGGNNDRIGGRTVDIADLVRDRKYDNPNKPAQPAGKIEGGIQYSRDLDRTNIDTASRRMTKFVDAFLAGQVKGQDTQLLGPTPNVLQLVGAEPIQMHIDGETVSKILSEKHDQTMTADRLKQSIEGIYDPLMIFDSPDARTGEQGKILVTEVTDRVGNQVIALVHLSKRSGHMIVNDIASVYGLEGIPDRAKIAPGKLLYVRDEEGLATSTTPNLRKLAGVVQKARDLGVNVLTQNDVVKRFGATYSQTQGVANPTTVPALEAAIKALTGKFLGNQLGRIVATTSSEIKSHWIAQVGDVNLESEGNAGKAQAFFDPTTKTIFLIADHIEAGTEQAVLAHELMHKWGKEVLGEAGWNRLHSVIDNWYQAKPGTDERRVYDYAADRVNAVGAELSTQELFPYAVDAAIKFGIKPSMTAPKGTVARWLESVRQNLKEVWGKITKKPETFKAQDLVDLAFAIAQRENFDVGLDGKSSVLSKDGSFKAWPKFNSWTRQEYNDVVSLLPEEYRDDPHRQEPLSAKDWDALDATAVPEIEALNAKVGEGTFRIDALGNIQADARKNDSASWMDEAIKIADKHGLGIYITGVKTSDIAPLRQAGFDTEMGLAPIVQREARFAAPSKSWDNYAKKSNAWAQPPVPMMSGPINNTAYGTIMSYKPRGFSKVLFSRDIVGKQGGRSADDSTPGASFDIGRVWRDLTHRNTFRDFDTSAEITSTLHSHEGNILNAQPTEFVLSHEVGGNFVSLHIEKTESRTGDVVLSSALELAGEYKKGTGIATKMYLSALNVAQKTKVGWMSDGVRSNDSLAIYDRLKAAGVPFTRVGRADFIDADSLGRIDLAEVARRLAKKNEPTAPESGGALQSSMEQDESGGYRDPSASEAKEVQDGIEGKTVIQVAKFIADNAPTEEYRLIASKVHAQLQRLTAAGMKFEFHVSHLGDRIPTSLFPARGQVIRPHGSDTTHVWIQGSDVSGKVGTSYQVVLHELLHAATQTAIYVGNRRVALGTKFNESYNDLHNVGNVIVTHLNDRLKAAGGDTSKMSQFEKSVYLGLNNAASDEGEVVSWALTNRPFQDYLETIPYKSKTLWSEFVSSIRKFLGISEKSETALSEVLRITEDLLNLPAEQLVTMADHLGMPTTINATGLVNSATQFSRSVITGQTNRKYTPEQLKALSNIGQQVQVPTLKERYQALTTDLGKRMIQGTFDQFMPLKELGKVPYMLARLSKGASGAFDTLLHGGKLKLSDGVYDFDETQKGGVLDKLLLPLQGEHHDFLRWVAANRAESLMGEGRENLFTPADIVALKALADGTTNFDYKLPNGNTTRDRTLIYADALKTFNGFQKNVMDLYEQSGGVDPEARKAFEREFYLPFYRVTEEDGGLRGGSIKSGLVRQDAIKRLKGGKDKLNFDLLDNTLLNWASLLDAAAKNRAAKSALDTMATMGKAIEAKEDDALQMAKSIGKKEGVVWYMENGQKRFFVVDDPYLLTAVTSLDYAGIKGPVMDTMRAFKHILTVSVTASPFFKVRNLLRDSVHVIASGPISYNPAKNIAQGWKLTDPKSDAYFRLLAGGGTIHFATMYEGSEAKRVQSLVDAGVDASTILNTDQKLKAFYRKGEKLLAAYNELGNRGEAVNRAALYAQLVKNDVSHAEASLQARDLMDFSMQGSFATVRFLTQVVPFMNARLEGIYKLGRAAKEDPQRFATVLGATAVFSLALLAAYHDDDDWKKRTEGDRNNFWWFKFGGVAFRIPKPFEVGAVATVAERMAEYIFDKEMTGKRFREQIMQITSDQLAMNPIPQMVKPIMGIYANKDSFSGVPIESMSMERLKPEYRYNDRTTMTARGISTAGNTLLNPAGINFLSPVQVDHLVRGYFAWLGTFAVSSADTILRTATDQPKQASSDVFKMMTGNMVSDLRDAPSRYVSNLYDQAREIEQAMGTYRALQKEGKGKEAAEFLADNRADLQKYKRIEHVKQAEAKFNERIRMIERSAMSADKKREQIRAINVQKDRIARMVQ